MFGQFVLILVQNPVFKEAMISSPVANLSSSITGILDSDLCFSSIIT
jgi:hypothetical protein